MWKMVIGEYFKSLTWGNIKENANYGTFSFFLVYIAWSPILQNVLENKEAWGTKEELIAWVCVVLPLVLGKLSAACFPAGLSKIMYLCPMNAEERKVYLNKKCVVRMAAPAFVSLIGAIIYLCMGGYFLYAVAMVCNHGALYICLACDTNTYGMGTQDDKGNYVMDQDSKRGLMEFFISITVYVTAATHMAVLAKEGSFVGGWLMLGIILAIELPMVIWFVKHWPEYVKKELYYETTDRVCNWKGLVKK